MILLTLIGNLTINFFVLNTSKNPPWITILMTKLHFFAYFLVYNTQITIALNGDLITV